MDDVGMVHERPPRQAALERASRSWRTLIETLPVGVYVCDAEGVVTDYNCQAEKLWGRAPDRGDPKTRYCGALKAYTLQGEPLALSDSPMSEVLRTGQAARNREVIVERPDGSQIYVLANVEPLFDEGELVGAVNCFQDVTSLKQSELRLAELERRQREILEALPAAVYTTDADGRITFYNEAAVEFSGRRPILGEDEWCVSWRLYATDGEPLPHDQCPMAVSLREGRPVRGAEAVAERPDGTRVPFIPFPTPLRGANGEVVGAINMLVDITDRKEAEDRQKVLVDELNHRVKNTLASVQSLAAHTLRGDGDPREMRGALEGRLLALSKVHNQLADHSWVQADLHSVLRDMLAPYRDGAAVSLEGPPVKLSARHAVALAMTLHELATNAAKYGALSTHDGQLNVCWRLSTADGGERLELDWRERGGPAVVPPLRRGFGSRFIEGAVERELDGQLAQDFAADGLRCRITAQLGGATA